MLYVSTRFRKNLKFKQVNMSSSTNNSGIDILGLLGIVFVVLKLTGIITWSWWWVTLPFWGGIALVIVILLLILFFKGLSS